jgi:hypothetical protein
MAREIPNDPVQGGSHVVKVPNPQHSGQTAQSKGPASSADTSSGRGGDVGGQKA